MLFAVIMAVCAAAVAPKALAFSQCSTPGNIPGFGNPGIDWNSGGIGCNGSVQNIVFELQYFHYDGSGGGTWYNSFNSGGNQNKATMSSSSCAGGTGSYTSGNHTFVLHWDNSSCGSDNSRFHFDGSVPAHKAANDGGGNLGDLCQYKWRVKTTFNDSGGAVSDFGNAFVPQCG